jgi:hypothetical protein
MPKVNANTAAKIANLETTLAILEGMPETDAVSEIGAELFKKLETLKCRVALGAKRFAALVKELGEDVLFIRWVENPLSLTA